MTTATDRELSALAIRSDQTSFDVKQREALIDVLRVRHATEADLAAFFHTCRRSGLDPFRKQIYLIAREEWDPDARARVWRQTIQTGIDGLRTIAKRVAASMRVPLSYEDTAYIDYDGNELKSWPDPEKPPMAVRVTVHLGEARYPGTAYYREYVPMVPETEWVEKNGQRKKEKTGRMVPSAMWQQRPVGQLEKCAEALALRRACPEDLSGMYEPAEMDHRDIEPTTLVDDGAEKARKSGTSTVGSLIWKIQRAKDRAALSELWNQAKDAGLHQRPDVEKAFLARGRKLQADAPSTGQESEPEPSEPGESAPADAQSNVQPSAEDLPFYMQDRLIAAGITTEEAARALSVDERDRILGVAAWGGDEDRAFEWAVSHIDQPHEGDPVSDRDE